MNLADIIQFKFENINFFVDVLLQDDGQGAYIKEWNLDCPRPTPEQLAIWNTEFESKNQLKINKTINQKIYTQLDEIDKQSIRALRTNDVHRLEQLELRAVALRAELLPVE